MWQDKQWSKLEEHLTKLVKEAKKRGEHYER